MTSIKNAKESSGLYRFGQKVIATFLLSGVLFAALSFFLFYGSGIWDAFAEDWKLDSSNPLQILYAVFIICYLMSLGIFSDSSAVAEAMNISISAPLILWATLWLIFSLTFFLLFFYPALFVLLRPVTKNLRLFVLLSWPFLLFLHPFFSPFLQYYSFRKADENFLEQEKKKVLS